MSARDVGTSKPKVLVGQERTTAPTGDATERPAVEFREVTKVYPNSDVRVLDRVSFSISPGEFLVLVGPSGCGKSTCLRLLAGLERVTGGEVVIDGRVVNQLPPKDRDVSMVFQSYALFPHLTVRDNLAFGLKVRGQKGAPVEEKVRDVAALLDLTDHLQKKPGQLSGGQRQRVALGRAIVRRARVFLLDEPLSNLDAKLRAKMRAEIKRIQRRLGVPTLYVTHDQTEAMTMGDRVAVLNAGKIQQVGTPDEVYNRPANLFVATFIGSPAMNVFRGTVAERAGGGLALSSPDLEVNLPDRVAGLVEPGVGVVVGVRPEDVVLGRNGREPGSGVAGGSSASSPVNAVVELVEPVGPYQIVHARAGQTPVLVQEAPRHREIGQRVVLEFPVDRLHVFDGVTELAL
ncbi:MAG: sn-glycerol-3-phosphate ABC transporter ATP-binding protein UgpC [Promethearchaeota archaeon]